MKILAALALALLIPTSAGCASPFVPLRSLAIDPSFSPDEISMIISAQDEWARRVPATEIPIRISSRERGGYIGPAPEAKCRRHSFVGYTRLRINQAPEIRICMRKIESPATFRVVVLHELGHAHARRGDHLGPRHVMYRAVELGTPRLTRADVRYVKDGL